MTRERDLFRAIVVSAVALVGPAAGCSDGDPAPVDSGASRIDASGGDDGGPIADADDGRDAAAPTDGGESDDAGEDSGMVLIL